MIDKNEIVRIFNEMDDSYDNLTDLWYAWLFSRLHYFIARDVIIPYSPKTVLDVGCGTGFQSLLHALTGSEVTGIDIADDLLVKARLKAITYQLKSNFELYPVHFPFVKRYNEKLFQILSNKLDYKQPVFKTGDACSLEFSHNTFDHVNICGSVVNFLDDYEKAISECIRVLKPGGTLFIEYDTKWNPDIFWTIVDGLLAGKLDYDVPLKVAIRNISPPFFKSLDLEYPFGDIEHPVIMQMKLFSNTEIKSIFARHHCKLIKHRTIHSITNFIPSTMLDTETPSKKLTKVFNALKRVEELNWNLPGCSSVLLYRKL